MSKTPRIRIPLEVKKYVFQRDKYQCRSCGKTTVETNLSIDHIIPLARGGQNDISNLQTLCFTCNQQKTDNIDLRFSGVILIYNGSRLVPMPCFQTSS